MWPSASNMTLSSFKSLMDKEKSQMATHKSKLILHACVTADREERAWKWVGFLWRSVWCACKCVLLLHLYKEDKHTALDEFDEGEKQEKRSVKNLWVFVCFTVKHDMWGLSSSVWWFPVNILDNRLTSCQSHCGCLTGCSGTKMNHFRNVVKHMCAQRLWYSWELCVCVWLNTPQTDRQMRAYTALDHSKY